MNSSNWVIMAETVTHQRASIVTHHQRSPTVTHWRTPLTCPRDFIIAQWESFGLISYEVQDVYATAKKTPQDIWKIPGTVDTSIQRCDSRVEERPQVRTVHDMLSGNQGCGVWRIRRPNASRHVDAPVQWKESKDLQAYDIVLRR